MNSICSMVIATAVALPLNHFLNDNMSPICVSNSTDTRSNEFCVCLFHCDFVLLYQAIEMLSGTKQSIPIIFFITDGAVENEREICEVMIKRLRNQGSDLCPRIYTFGIGNDLL